MTPFTDKTLLITGGTGSFGNAVLRRFLDTDIKEIRIFSRDEKKQDDMRHRLQNPKVKFYIGDVRDKRSVDNVMTGVDYVFQAAADVYKRQVFFTAFCIKDTRAVKEAFTFSAIFAGHAIMSVHVHDLPVRMRQTAFRRA